MKGISKTLTKLVYTSKQREALELFFLSLPMPPLEERQRIEELSETTGLSRDQIKMWIRNRRNRGAYKGRVNLAIEQVSVLEWIFINITTYPSVSLKHLLASELDIRYDQIQKWFETRRLRGPPAILSRASNMDEEEWQRTVQRIHELVLLSKADENEPKRKGGASHAQSNILSPKRKNRGESPESKMFKRSRLEAARVAESPAYDQIQNRTHSEASFSVPASNFFADSMYHQPSHSSTSSLANSQPLPHRFDVFQSPSQPQHPQQRRLATSSLASSSSSASTTSLPTTSQFFSRSQSTTPLDYRNLKQQQQTPLPPSSTPSTSSSAATTPSFSIGSPSPSPSNIPVSPYSNPFLSPPLPPLSSLIQDLHLSTTPNSSPMNSPSLASLSGAPPPPPPSASPSPTPSLGSSGSSATTPNGTPSLTVTSGAGMASNPLASQSTPLPLLAPWRPYLSSSNGFFQE